MLMKNIFIVDEKYEPVLQDPQEYQCLRMYCLEIGPTVIIDAS